jgi:hypothetical protein
VTTTTSPGHPGLERLMISDHKQAQTSTVLFSVGIEGLTLTETCLKANVKTMPIFVSERTTPNASDVGYLGSSLRDLGCSVGV